MTWLRLLGGCGFGAAVAAGASGNPAVEQALGECLAAGGEPVQVRGGA